MNLFDAKDALRVELRKFFRFVGKLYAVLSFKILFSFIQFFQRDVSILSAKNKSV